MSCSAHGSGIFPVFVVSFLAELWTGQVSARRVSRIFRNAIPPWGTKSLRLSRARSSHRSEGWGVELSNEERSLSRQTAVGVFWDLDNKPPVLVPPYDAAIRLRNLASEFGEVVEMVAYANKNAFTYVPGWVREQRQERRLLDQLEIRGLVQVERPYFCKLCGRMCRTNIALKRHFKQVHERERKRRLAFLKTLRGKRRAKFLSKIAGEEVKYKEAARRLLIPKSGYGLGSELKRAGVDVKTVESKPQAADEALKKHIALCLNKGVECICLVSDDSDFLGILRTAKKKGLEVVVVGDAGTLDRVADVSFSWEDVASGRYSRLRWMDDYASTIDASAPDEDDDYDEPDDHYCHDESVFFESIENAMNAGYGYRGKGNEIFADEIENDECVENEVRAYFSEPDDDEEYLANLRWTLRN